MWPQVFELKVEEAGRGDTRKTGVMPVAHGEIKLK